MRQNELWVLRSLLVLFVGLLLNRCRQEEEAWSAVIQAYNARQARTVEALARQRQQSGTSTSWDPSDTSDPLHERESQGAQLAQRCTETARRTRGASPSFTRCSPSPSFAAICCPPHLQPPAVPLYK